MAKSKKVEKETRRLMEGIAELVKKKGDRYKFKSKNKKAVRRVKKTCPHWTIRKGEVVPAVVRDDEHPNMWRCKICGARFPIEPKTPEGYDKSCQEFLEAVDQMMFWSVRMGGDSDDTKMFLALKREVPKFRKVSRQLIRHINKRQQYEDNRRKSDGMEQFGMYTGYNYSNI